MNWIQIVNGLVVVIGIPTLIGVFINIGRKLQILETIEGDLKENIRPDLKDVRERFSALEGKMSGFFATASPVSLLPKGVKIIEKSGLKKYIDDHKDDFMKQCCGDKPTNQYDIQTSAFNFFDKLDFGEFESKLKETSFQYGMSLEMLRRIGGIYFRDILLQKYNFKPEDLDKPKV